jgi:hypothetical protein
MPTQLWLSTRCGLGTIRAPKPANHHMANYFLVKPAKRAYVQVVGNSQSS